MDERCSALASESRSSVVLSDKAEITLSANSTVTEDEYSRLMSRVAKKPVFGVNDQVRVKQDLATIEDG